MRVQGGCTAVLYSGPIQRLREVVLGAVQDRCTGPMSDRGRTKGDSGRRHRGSLLRGTRGICSGAGLFVSVRGKNYSRSIGPGSGLKTFVHIVCR